MTFIVTHGTYQVYRVEVCTVLEHFLLLGVVHVNLRAFEDLQGNRSVTVVCKERATTRFAYVLHHSADTHRTVQFVLQIDSEYGIFEVFRFRILAEKFLLQELEHFHHLVVRIFAAVKQFEVLECLLLQGDEYAGNQFLISNGVFLQFVGNNVVDVLDKDNIGIEVIQVLNQRAVSTGTEQQFAVVAERLVVHVGSNGVGTRFLLGECDVVIYSVAFGKFAGLFFHQFLEEFTMLGRYGEVHVDFAALSGCVHSPFGKMFFQRGACAFGIFMEFEQTLRQCAVIQAGSFE